jgi:hypothetical protein
MEFYCWNALPALPGNRETSMGRFLCWKKYRDPKDENIDTLVREISRFKVE